MTEKSRVRIVPAIKIVLAGLDKGGFSRILIRLFSPHSITKCSQDLEPIIDQDIWVQP